MKTTTSSHDVIVFGKWALIKKLEGQLEFMEANREELLFSVASMESETTLAQLAVVEKQIRYISGLLEDVSTEYKLALGGYSRLSVVDYEAAVAA